MALVPCANEGISNTPSGPFQSTVRTSARASSMLARLCLPRSTMCQLAGTFSAGIVLYSVPRVTSLATTTSTGSTTLTPAALGGGEDRPRVLDAVGLGEALADGLALGEQERVRHPAADDHHVDLVEQVLEHLDLVADLGAADDRRERVLRVLEQLAEVGELLLHEQAGVGGAELRDPDGAGVRPVGGAEGVVHVDVAVRREGLGEGRVVRLLLHVEAEVLEQQDLPVAHAPDGVLGADARGRRR